MSDRQSGLQMSAVGAQRLAIASSVAALLMFGALVYNGTSASRSVTVVAAPAQAVSMSETPVMASTAEESEPVYADNNEDESSKVRRAVTDLMRDRFPNSKVEGVFLLNLTRDSNIYLARADMNLPAGRSAVPSLVCQYVRKNGSSYWRAESLTDEEAAAQLKQAVAAGN